MPDIKLSEEALQFITTARGLMRQDTQFSEVSKKARVKLLIQLEEMLEDKENRKPVLRLITGLPISTQNNLTHHTTCTLIELTLDGAHEKEIREIEHFIERLAEDQPGIDAEHLIKEWLQSDLSDLPDPDIPF